MSRRRRTPESPLARDIKRAVAAYGRALEAQERARVALFDAGVTLTALLVEVGATAKRS